MVSLDDGTITVSLAYDDVTLVVSTVIGVNNSTRTVTVTATPTGQGKTFTQIMAPGFSGSASVTKQYSFSLVQDTTQPAPYPLSQNAWILSVD